MRLISNSGNDRVVDALRKALPGAGRLDVASPEFSLFAFAEIRDLLEGVAKCRVVLPTVENSDIRLLGGNGDRAFRNQLKARALARECARWIKETGEVRGVPGPLPQSALIAGDGKSEACQAITGNSAFSTCLAGRGPRRI